MNKPKQKQKHNLTEAELEEALKTCASEPIHIPGSIQPHGALLIVNPANYQIIGCSENLTEVLGLEIGTLIQKRLEDVLLKNDIDQLDSLLAQKSAHNVRSLRVLIAGQLFELTAHLSFNNLLLEFEKAVELNINTNDDFFYDQLRGFSKDLREAKTIDGLFDVVVKHVCTITGFDRVKLYRFDAEWNGQVVAESKKDGIPSYKGLHFPASDIPEQARILYAKNYIRIISDVDYIPSPILRFDGSEEAVDLSFSVLRSVSPVHVQYLKNMDVLGSMSISIMQDDKLWGLVACHNLSPIYLSQRVRMVCELMGHMFSSLLSSYNQMETREDEANRKVLLERLAVSLKKDNLNQNLIEANSQAVIDALDAHGLAYRSGGKIKIFGDCPEKALVDALFDYLSNFHKVNVFQTDNAEEELELPNGGSIIGGILAMPLDKEWDDFIVWFRQPEVVGVNWAGKPEKEVTETIAGYRLTPRSSFALWRETVKNRSLSWNKVDVATAQSIARLMLEYEKSVAKLQSKYKSEFLADMSHELRTPMNAIIGISSILAKNSEMDEGTAKLVNTLHANSEHLLELINDLLDLSKVEANQITLEHIPFNLAETLDNTVSRLQALAEEKHLKLNLNIPPPDRLNFFGDPTKIKQVLTNIISNAIKFTHEGFVNILVKIEPSGVVQTDNVFFEISDTGIGMADNQVAKLFQKYGQASTDTHRKYGGTGLGLAISKQLVELIGGTITASSRLGVGSRFTIKLPLSRNDSATSPFPVSVPVLKKSYQVKVEAKPTDIPKEVLLVEDYDGNVIIATHVLEDMGCKVTVATNGQEAINELKKRSFDLIFMDIKMPVMDGIEATQLIRKMQAEGIIAPCPIVGMSANAFISDKEKGIEVGMDKYITKPFSYDDMKAVADEYLFNVAE